MKSAKGKVLLLEGFSSSRLLSGSSIKSFGYRVDSTEPLIGHRREGIKPMGATRRTYFGECIAVFGVKLLPVQIEPVFF